MRAKKPQANTIDALLTALEHPHKPAICALRQIILAADERIGESIKWNAPSFATTEHFATFNLHAKGEAQLVFHRGAKPRETLDEQLAVADPAGLLAWRSNDRAVASFRSLDDVDAKRAALDELVRAWIEHV